MQKSVQTQVRAGLGHALRISAPKHVEHQEPFGPPSSWAAGLSLDGSSTVGGCVPVSRAVVRDATAEPASSQGLGLRGSRDAVGSPWVAVMWRFSSPGSCWPFWTRCRSSARVTEAGACSADASPPLRLQTPPHSSMSHHQLTLTSPGHKHFRVAWEQPPSRKGKGRPSTVSRDLAQGKTSRTWAICTEAAASVTLHNVRCAGGGRCVCKELAKK